MSFSGEVKEELTKVEIKKNCCRLAFAKGVWLSASSSDGTKRIRFSDSGGLSDMIVRMTDLGFGRNRVAMTVKKGRYTEIIATGLPGGDESLFDEKCADCTGNFLLGAFLSCGRISSPGEGYFLEFDFSDALSADRFAQRIDISISGAKRFRRGEKEIVYYKDSSAIEDFTAIIGAHRATFEFMNSKIERQLRSDANRYSNFEAANLVRAVSNSKKQVDAIKSLIESGRLSMLPPELEQTAKLRLEHPEMTLTELSKLTNPPVSKSGLNHRLARIIEYAEED